MTRDEAIDQIAGLPYVTNVRLWDMACGHARVYIETAKFNGGKSWNGGRGYGTLYIDVRTHQLIAREVAGAATRDKLAETLTTLRQIAQQMT